MPKTALRFTDLREEALGAGIDLIGATSAAPFVIRGEKEESVDPGRVLPGARSVVVAGFRSLYRTEFLPSAPGKPRGKFPPYGSRVFTPMTAHCRAVVGGWLKKRGFKAVASDEIPVKPAAVRAGLGRYGKNAVVITEKYGSWVMFECLVTDAPLDGVEQSIETPVCGDCGLCLEACPTRAITAPYRVNKAKCITAWLWGNYAPAPLRALQGDRLFGCGECLKACPRNAAVIPCEDYPSPLESFSDSPELIPLATGEAEYFRRMVPSFPRQAGIEALRGNAVIALGNIGDPAAVDALAATLRHDRPQIRAYSAWALGRIGGRRALAVLEDALAGEKEDQVAGEIRGSLA